jgi:hypothetical protein
LRVIGAFSGAVAQAKAALASMVIRITLAIVFVIPSLPILRKFARRQKMLPKFLTVSTGLPSVARKFAA